MVGLHRSGGRAVWANGLRVLVCVREWWIIEDLWRRRDTGGNDEGFDVETPSKVLEGIAAVVGFYIPLIPGKPKRCVRNLNHEEVKVGIGRQAGCEKKQIFGSSGRYDFDIGSGIRKTRAGTFRDYHLERNSGMVVVVPCTGRTGRRKGECRSDCRSFERVAK